LPIPLVVDGRVVDDQVAARVTRAGDRAAVPKEAVVTAIADTLDGDARQAVENMPAREGYVTAESIQAAGLQARFDASQLAFVIEIPQELKRPAAITGRREATRRGDLDAPSTVSAYANAVVSQTWRREDGESERELADVFLDGAARVGGLGGVTIEWFGTLQETQGFRRDDVRLVYDRPGSLLRATAGDLNFRTQGFQSSEDLLGLSLAREFRLQPETIFEPRGRRSFVVERPSNVTVIVDGQTVRQLRLDPGRYLVQDLARTTGANDVTIEIDDGTGIPRRIEFSVFSGAGLLGEGVSDYSIAAGVRSSQDDAGRRVYDADDPVVAGFYRYGLTDWLSLGANIQADQDNYLAGTDVALATGLGLFSTEAAWSDRPDSDGYIVDLNYEAPPLRLGRFDDVQFDASALYRSREFQEFQQVEDEVATLDPLNQPLFPLAAPTPEVTLNDRLTLDLRVSSPISETVSASLSTGFIDRRNEVDQYTLRPSVTLRIADAYSLRINATARHEDSTAFETFLSLSVRFGPRLSGQTSIEAGIDEGPLTTLELQRSDSGNRVASTGFRVTGSRDATTEQVDGSLSYVANRFDVNVDLGAQRSDGQNQEAAAVDVGFGLAMADGEVALGRPVSDSFAVVHRHPTLADRRVEVNPSDDGPVANTGILGPALIPDLNSYDVERLDYTVDDLPLGYDLGDQRVDTQLPYRGGIDVQVGSAAVVSVIGTAIAPDGEPLALAAGEVEAATNDIAEEARIFFTNRAGRFALQKLSPGSYTIRAVYKDQALTATFAIDPDAVGLERLGELRFQDSE
jgi:outer membrane usher protein